MLTEAQQRANVAVLFANRKNLNLLKADNNGNLSSRYSFNLVGRCISYISFGKKEALELNLAIRATSKSMLAGMPIVIPLIGWSLPFTGTRFKNTDLSYLIKIQKVARVLQTEEAIQSMSMNLKEEYEKLSFSGSLREAWEAVRYEANLRRLEEYTLSEMLRLSDSLT